MALLVSCSDSPQLTGASGPRFEALLPGIEQMARRAFRFQPFGRRGELVAEVVARAYAMYVRLVERGRAALAYSTALARFAIRQVKSGRRMGGRQNVRDVLSEAGQRSGRVRVASLTALEQRAWEEVVADPRASPAEIAICRLDFAAWLGRLGCLQRSIAEKLAAGDTTGEAARYFRVSPARISQLRRELHDNWTDFQRGALSP